LTLFKTGRKEKDLSGFKILTGLCVWEMSEREFYLLFSIFFFVYINFYFTHYREYKIVPPST